MLYLSTRQGSKAIYRAKSLQLVYPKKDEVSADVAGRRTALSQLSRTWNLYTVFDFILGILFVIEIVTGLQAADMGLQFYLGIHLPFIVVISIVIGIVLSSFIIRFLSPFSIGLVDPVVSLLNTLEALIEASKPEEGGGYGYVDNILQRVVAQEIESFMELRAMGEGERGRFLEYLSEQGGVIGEVASSLLWPL